MIIQNERVCAVIDIHGAELTSFRKQGSDEELIWTADKEYWGRHAPMLFPIVGKVWNGEYKVVDRKYNLPQHGFARDCDFKVLCHDKESVVLCLESDAESLKVYPYPFRLEATYRLEENILVVEWRIKNPGAEPMYFQIGAHPGFNYRDFSKDDFIHGYFRLTSGEEPVSRLIIGQLTPEGYRSDSAGMMELDSDAMLPITPGLFANDALVLEEHQIDQVILYDKIAIPILPSRLRMLLYGGFGLHPPKTPRLCASSPGWDAAIIRGMTGIFPEGIISTVWRLGGAVGLFTESLRFRI